MGLDHKQPLQLDKIRDGFRDRSTHINLADDWWVAEDTILQEAAQQRTSRFAAKKNCQKLVSGLDWTVARLAQRKLSATQSAHIRSWTQAAIHYKHGDKPKPCPLCHVPTTPKHIIWLCKWHHQQAHEALPVSWTERLQDPLGNGFRKRLRITSPNRFPSRATAVGKAWNHSGHGPTSRDKRAQAWVFAFCVHTFSLGTLLRKGTITGMPQASPTTDPEIDAGEAGDHYAVDFF